MLWSSVGEPASERKPLVAWGVIGRGRASLWVPHCTRGTDAIPGARAHRFCYLRTWRLLALLRESSQLRGAVEIVERKVLYESPRMIKGSGNVAQ